MKSIKISTMKTTFLILFFFFSAFLTTSEVKGQNAVNESDEVVIVWTSDDPYLAERMVLMYAHAAINNGWFSEVTLIIWGPSAKMVAENLKIQEKLKAMQADGVQIKACIVCADAYGVTEDLKKLDFEVKGMGKPLTDYLKGDAKVLTF
jgi:hypothetical protein